MAAFAILMLSVSLALLAFHLASLALALPRLRGGLRARSVPQDAPRISLLRPLKIIIPPPKAAVRNPQSAHNPTVRDCHIAEIETNGRMAWQKPTGYNRRRRIETEMGRWKTVIGPKLKARNFDDQTAEAKIGVRALNRMIDLGRPEFKRVT
ncbi:MAG: hypothetical protein KGH84_00815 [Paracoccaceae bacterium]|nr:hypothetical protein [Paracoccaceae bacterium]